MSPDRLWPRYVTPDDLADIESAPLSDRGLPDSTYAVLERAAALWPDRTAVSVLPDASRWQQPGVIDTVLLLRGGCDRAKPWPVRRLDGVFVTFLGQAAENSSGTAFSGDSAPARLRGALESPFNRPLNHEGFVKNA